MFANHLFPRELVRALIQFPVLAIGTLLHGADPVLAAPAELELHSARVSAWQADGLDLRNSDAVFAWVFRQLPDEIQVLPTENYCYWKLSSGGREVRGNFRLANGLREKGVVSFAYAEWQEFPVDPKFPDRIEVARWVGKAEGVTVVCPDPFTCEVSSEGKTVRFLLHRIPQLPPPAGVLDAAERMIARTWDESGMPFYLMYDPRIKTFFWVLNEEQRLPEFFTEHSPGVHVGRRTGFVFWTDPAHANRKILTGVRSASVERNDFYDGPFDQLADNYAAQSGLRDALLEAFPTLHGQVDLYGYFTTGADAGGRVALTSYQMYESLGEALQFAAVLSKAESPVELIAGAGKNR